MLNNKVIYWGTIITACLIANSINKPIALFIYSILTNIGFSIHFALVIAVVLPQILFVEIVGKALTLQLVFPSLKFILTQSKLWSHVNQDELNRCTLEIEQLGFVQLTDYTLSSSARPSLARLFSHPDKFCFVEVFQVGNLPMVCSISCLMEKNWSLAVVNRSVLSSISYAFFRHPRKLFKKIENVPVNILFQSLLEWREQICSDLNLEVIQDVRSEIYFEKQRSNRIDRKRTLSRKSIIWAVLEMFWFSLNPKYEWLGDYEKLKLNR